MLKLLVMIFVKMGVFCLSLLMGLTGTWGRLAVNRPMITSPRPGEALQGVVAVRGSTDVLDFESAELSFSYQDEAGETWFLIAEIQEAVENQPLADWDTTTIADGTYRLRLRIFLDDGNELESVVAGLRVRNYTAVETSTPAAVQPQPTTAAPATALPAELPRVASSTGPENPAEVTQDEILASVKWGAVLAVGAFVLLGIVLGLRGMARR